MIIDVLRRAEARALARRSAITRQSLPIACAVVSPCADNANAPASAGALNLALALALALAIDFALSLSFMS
jgi:hypothetical protein